MLIPFGEDHSLFLSGGICLKYCKIILVSSVDHNMCCNILRKIGSKKTYKIVIVHFTPSYPIRKLSYLFLLLYRQKYLPRVFNVGTWQCAFMTPNLFSIEVNCCRADAFMVKRHWIG